jgi:mRNA interferase MazF
MIEVKKAQVYLEWLKEKLFLDSKSTQRERKIVRRGEVYYCDFGVGIGCEMRKKRPCVVLQNDSGNRNSSTTIIAPITHTNADLPIVVPIDEQRNKSGNIIIDGYVNLGNVVCVSKARLSSYTTKLEKEEMLNIDRAISVSLDIDKHYKKLENILVDREKYVTKLKEKVLMLEEKVLELEEKTEVE